MDRFVIHTVSPFTSVGTWATFVLPHWTCGLSCKMRIIIKKTTLQSCCEVKELMHVKHLEEWLVGIQHCYLLLLLLIVTFIEHLLCNNYTALKILHALSNLKIVVVLKYIHRSLISFRDMEIDSFPPWAGLSYLLLKNRMWQKGKWVTSGTMMRSITAWSLFLGSLSLGEASWHVRKKDPLRGSGHNQACRIVALVSTSTIAWWSRTTQLRYSWFPDPQRLCVIIYVCCFNLLRLGNL